CYYSLFLLMVLPVAVRIVLVQIFLLIDGFLGLSGRLVAGERVIGLDEAARPELPLHVDKHPVVIAVSGRLELLNEPMCRIRPRERRGLDRIEIDDTNKVSAKGLDVVDTDQQTGADLSLDTDGGLIRARERLGGLRDVGVGRLIGRRPTAVRIRVAGVGDLYGALVAQEPGEQRVVEEHAVVEDPEAPSDRCLPRAERTPCEAET